jgi:hypothetical protein
MSTLRVYGECEWDRSSKELDVLVAAIRRRLQRPVDVEAIFFVEQGLYGVQLTLKEGRRSVAEGKCNHPDLFLAMLGAVHDLEDNLGLTAPLPDSSQ